MISLVAGQGVLEPDRAAPGAVQPDGEAFVVQLQKRLAARTGGGGHGGGLGGLFAAGGDDEERGEE